MERAELLGLMDRHMVAMYAADACATPGGEVSERSGLVCCRTPRGTAITNLVMPTGAVEVATLRAETARVYGRVGAPFSVWTRAHADGALAAALAPAGFHELTAVPGMVLDAAAEVRVTPPAGVTIRPVTDEPGRAAYARVASEAWTVYGTPPESTAEHFARLESLAGPSVTAFLAFRDGRAVAGAAVYFAHGVAGLGWVATLPAEFRRGYGAAVTAAALREAFARDAKLVCLQASPLGAPVYRRLGFSTPTHYRVFVSLE